MQRKLDLMEDLATLETKEEERCEKFAEEELRLDEDEVRVLRGYKALKGKKPSEEQSISASTQISKESKEVRPVGSSG